MSLSTKKIRSQPPDVIVAVGQGDAMQEFECYKIALSFASPYFDAMLSTDMVESNSGRITLPDKNPEEWKLFYSFIDPAKLREGTPKLDQKNGVILTKWFHEFQMETYLKDCDDVLSRRLTLLHDGDRKGLWDVSYGDVHRARDLKERKSCFCETIRILQTACTYGLEKATTQAETFIAKMTGDELERSHDLFDIPSIKSLIELSLPLKKDEARTFHAHGKSTVIWDNIPSEQIWTSIDTVSAEVLDSSNQVAVDMLSVAIYHAIQHVAKEEEVEQLKMKLSWAT